jgi:hypothetical protein
VTTEIRRGTGRPTGYYAADGGRLPSVTTINGCYGYKGQLENWFKRTWYEAALAGVPFNEVGKKATDIGTLVHSIIESEVHGLDYPEVPNDLRESVESAYRAFREWQFNNRLQIVATELALVSEKHRYGGTIDAVVRDSKGRLALGDWKSSKKVRGDYLRQLAAYGELWNENEEEQLTGGFHLVRFSKEKGDLETRYFPELDDELQMFLTIRALYEQDKAVQRRAA